MQVSSLFQLLRRPLFGYVSPESMCHAMLDNICVSRPREVCNHCKFYFVPVQSATFFTGNRRHHELFEFNGPPTRVIATLIKPVMIRAASM